MQEYIDSKLIKIGELDERFSLSKEYTKVRGDLEECGGCGRGGGNIKRLPSEPWTSSIYCHVCPAITVMIHSDRMGGNHTDHFRVYTA